MNPSEEIALSIMLQLIESTKTPIGMTSEKIGEFYNKLYSTIQKRGSKTTR